jgi:hypothetical protein
MRVRVEIQRKTPTYKRSRSRNNPPASKTVIIHEASVADAKAELKALKDAGAFDEGFDFVEARLYDADAFAVWVKSGDFKKPPQPFQVLSEI